MVLPTRKPAAAGKEARKIVLRNSRSFEEEKKSKWIPEGTEIRIHADVHSRAG